MIDREDSIRMAREAGFSVLQTNVMPHKFELFAAVVAAAAVASEREACAKVCDELHWPWHMGDNSGPKECAAAIRKRSSDLRARSKNDS